MQNKNFINVLGLDLGTTSIGFAHVKESMNNQPSEIVQIGVRVNPLTTEEQTNFEKGRPTSINAERTQKRGARRNLERYKIRRKNLLEILTKANIINSNSTLNENGKDTTFETWKLRSKAASEPIDLEQFARILLAINKKRGYKSSRKTKNSDDGVAVDGMAIAKIIYEENLTPGQYVYERLKSGQKQIPDFYRSDLQNEFDKVWHFQKAFYPNILTDEFYKEIEGKGQRATSALFWIKHQFNTAEIKSIDDDLKNEKTIKLPFRDQKRLQAYKWRSTSIEMKLEKEQVAYVLTEINSNLNNSSGYLGAISDRSKELYFNKLTVGQYLYDKLIKNKHNPLKNQVFYRQDYLDEFEVIWNTQAKYHPELTTELKQEIRDVVIFYQRKLKSQKGLISLCEFEQKDILIDGKKKLIGLRAAPKSSPLFQEFKIWQVLNNLLFKKAGSKKRSAKKENKQSLFEEEKEIFGLSLDSKELLFEELNIKGNLNSSAILQLLGYNPKDWEVNYSNLEGNRTNQSLYNAYLKILDLEGYNSELLKLSDKDEINIAELKTPASEIKEMIKSIFKVLNINTLILEFDAELEGKEFENQPSFQLWHLLHSAEDDSKTYSEEDKLIFGSENIGLKKMICEKFGFKPEHAKIISNITLQNDYGNLSSKAMRKIFPFIRELKFSEACDEAGYRHSKHSLTRDELQNRILKSKLDLLKKNSLRNPVVEKILNQMVNVVNSIIDKENDKLESQGNTRNFHFDEIRIELARELKKNAKERAEMTSNINSAKLVHEKIHQRLQSEFNILHPTRNDIIKFKLYEELKGNNYKDLYTNKYISKEILFSKEIDIEHIIPQSKVLDDSFSNKTIVFRDTNLEKGNQTAFDYIENKFGPDMLTEYQERVLYLFEQGKKDKEEGITKAKYLKLLKRESEIGDGFIARDLRESQYIAKKAKEMLFEITKSVVSTSGSITDKLREDWGLTNVMKELNLPKYRSLGMTEMETRKHGNKVEVIKDWSKRNDHRHHAMDALTIAFTSHSHIQYLNFLNARKNENHKEHKNITGIEKLITALKEDDKGQKKRVFIEPIPNFRAVAKEHLESIIVSHKAKNKVVTKNKNRIASKIHIQQALTPRGQLHKETIYGKYKLVKQKFEKINAKFDLETIDKVSNPIFKQQLLKRILDNDSDPKKAFAGSNAISKNPIFLDDKKEKTVPESVKLVWTEEVYSIRKDISPDNFKDEKSIDKVLDEAVKTILKNRLREFNGDSKKAFSDLDKKPIWFNEAKGLSIKRVTISGVSTAEALRHKKDHFGNSILNKDGHEIPVDFVSTGNNHHVAIYLDENNNLQDNVISFYEAVIRVNHGLPVIDKRYNEHLGWKFLYSMKQNEFFVFPNPKTGFNPNEIDLLDVNNKKILSPNIYRVQKFSKLTYGNSVVRDYVFRHHLETTVEEKNELKDISYKSIKSLGFFEGIMKIRINHLGDVVKVGEY